MDVIRERYADGEITELDGVSVDYDDWHFNVRPSNTEPLLRLNLESLVSREDMERQARRGPGADPRVSDGRRPEEALEQAALAGVHRLADPDPVRGRAGQRLPDRGRPADPDRRRAQLRQGARRARATSSPPTATRSRTSSLILLTHQHIDHLGLVGDRRRALGGRGRGARRGGASASPTSTSEAEADDAMRGRADAAQRDPGGDRAGAATASPRCFRGWGSPVEVTRPLADGEVIELGDRKLEVQHRPGHSAIGHRLLGRRAPDPASPATTCSPTSPPTP